MIILGHPLVPSPALVLCSPHDDLTKTPTGSIIVTHFSKTTSLWHEQLMRTKIPYGLIIETLPHALLAMALKVPYLLCTASLAPYLQKNADNYLSDTKIILMINEDREMSWAATKQIDGVAFRQSFVEYEMLTSL